jgi:hypothetical protein
MLAAVALGAAIAGCGSGDDNSQGPASPSDAAADSAPDAVAVDAVAVDAGDGGGPDGNPATDAGDGGPGADATLPSADGGDAGASPDATLPDGATNAGDGGMSPDATLPDAEADAGDGGGFGQGDVSVDAPVGPTLDSPSEAMTDAASDASVATLLVPGSGLITGGMLTSGDVLYYDGNTKSYYAAPQDGGAPTLVYTAPLSLNSGYDGVLGNVAYVWAWNASTYQGTLTTWTPGQDAGVTLTGDGLAYLYQTFWASDDSAHIAYLVATNPSSNLGALYAANADGSNPTVLLPSIDINAATAAAECFPRAVFRGHYLVVSYCLVGGGSATTMVESFDVSNGWAPGTTITNFTEPFLVDYLDRAPFTFAFAVDPDGGAIAAATPSSADGGIQVFPIAGDGGSVAVDPSVPLTGNLSFTGSVTNPWSIYYNDSAGALHKANAANPAPQVLVDAGVTYFNALSGDGQWMLVSSSGSNLGWFADLSLVSLQNPGSPALVASQTLFDSLPVASGVYLYGGPRGFTADSTYALVMTDLTQTSDFYLPWVGYLRAMPVTSPSTATVLSKGYVTYYKALTGSKVLVTDNLQGDVQAATGAVDLRVVDPSTGSAVTIASGVAGDNAVSADMKTIAFSANLAGGPGIYVSPLP